MSSILNPGKTGQLRKYLIRDHHSDKEYYVMEKLAELFRQATKQAEGVRNPWQIRKIFHALIPRCVREKITQKMFWHGQPGFIILKNLPEDCCDKDVFAAGLTSLCSLPISYRGEGGMVIRIKPVRQTAANPSFANSVDFNLHSDLSYTFMPADTLIMVVKNVAKNGGGESLFSCLADIVHLLPYEIYHQLRLSQYYFEAPNHYLREHSERTGPVPIITNTEAGLRVRMRPDKLRADNPQAEFAARVFNSMANLRKEQILLPKNSAVLINQRYVLHGRTEFEPTYDENDRELLRCYGTVNPGKYENLNDETGELSY